MSTATRVASSELERLSQGRTIEGRGRLAVELRGVTHVSGVVVCSPIDPPRGGGDPETLGELAVTVLATGGGSWSRAIALPRWGGCIPVPEGTIEVSVGMLSQQSANVSFQPARAGTSWQRDSIDLAALQVVTVEPPPYAVRMLVGVIEGSAQILSAIAPALVAPAAIEWPASAGNITAGALGARLAIAWECTA